MIIDTAELKKDLPNNLKFYIEAIENVANGQSYKFKESGNDLQANCKCSRNNCKDCK